MSLLNYLRKRRDFILITVIITIYVLIFTYLTYLRYIDFFTTNWDFGIAQQLLWSTTHGRLMYEAGDFVTSNSLSFLQVHSTYIAFIIAAIYWLLPQASTLFGLQTSVIALAIVPLYFIAKKIGLNRGLFYLSSIVYLLNFYLLIGMFYDFHWESFLPLEFLVTYYLLLSRRYKLSLIPFVAGCATLEVFPFLMIGMILYFAYEDYGPRLLLIWKRITEANGKIYISYLVLAVLAYVMIRVGQDVLIPHLLGIGGSPVAVSSSVTSLFNVNINSGTVLHSLYYWLLLYASFAFIPLIYPRQLLTISPWLFATFLIVPGYAGAIGFQYGLIAVGAVTVAFIYGLKVIQDNHPEGSHAKALLGSFVLVIFLLIYALYSPGSRVLISEGINIKTLVVLLALPLTYFLLNFLAKKGAIKGINGSGHLQKKHMMGLIIILLILIGFNVVMSPLNTNNFQASPSPSYAFEYTSNPAFPMVQKLVACIPAGSQVLASDNLFPYVANDIHAYSTYGFNSTPPYLPFNSTNLPEYVLFDTSMPYFPSSLQPLLFNSSIYGIRAYLFDKNYPGSVYLFEKGYTGETASYYVQRPLWLYDYANLSHGPYTTVLYNYTPPVLYIPQTAPSGNTFWFGPYASLMPGLYQATFTLKTSSNYSGYILTLDATTDFGTNTLASEAVYGYEFGGGGEWVNFTLTFSVDEPVTGLELRGVDFSGATGVYLNDIVLQQLSPNFNETLYSQQFNYLNLDLNIGESYQGFLEHLTNQPELVFWHGPYASLPPGNYSVTYWIMTSSNISGPVLLLDVSANTGTEILTEAL
ncbi:MAG: DUF2079 domain-containing protein, partial [Thermoplasmatales archaeon]